MYRQYKYIAAFLAQNPCKACFAQRSEFNNALSWSVNIEKYYHGSSCASWYLRCRAGSKLDRQGLLLRRSLPFGTHVRVTNLSNNRSAVLVVNDRGPYIRGRIVDVSTGAAEVLGFRHAGVAQVMVETLPD